MLLTFVLITRSKDCENCVKVLYNIQILRTLEFQLLSLSDVMWDVCWFRYFYEETFILITVEVSSTKYRVRMSTLQFTLF